MPKIVTKIRGRDIRWEDEKGCVSDFVGEIQDDKTVRIFDEGSWQFVAIYPDIPTSTIGIAAAEGWET